VFGDFGEAGTIRSAAGFNGGGIAG